eukprot:m51a1_g5770 putative neuroendocrine convertase 1-like (561) ;mRNA; r:1242052-1244200
MARAVLVAALVLHAACAAPPDAAWHLDSPAEEGPTGQVAVRVTAGVDADAVAASLGLTNLGAIGELKGFYMFGPGRKRATARAVEGAYGVEWAEEQVARVRQKRGAYRPPPPEVKDPLYSAQWHLSSIDAQGAWLDFGAKGEGVTVCVVDDGIEYNHPDIKENWSPEASWDYNRGQALPTPTAEDDHGTSAGGVAAARDNSVCGVGVAYRAGLSAIRLISQIINDVYSVSWGPVDDGKRLEGPGPLARIAMLDSVRKGRGGRGNVYVWAAGNGARQRDNCNYDGYANSRLTITVAAVNVRGGHPSYSEQCAALMVSAPSGDTGMPAITTSDLMGARGISGADCASTFTGTSASAPIVAGVVALMLSANKELGYRDVQHIVVRSCYRTSTEDADWAQNGAGLWHSHKFGFGVINASRAVELSLGWRHVAEEVSHASSTMLALKAVEDGTGAPAVSEIDVDRDIVVEWVEVWVNITVAARGDIGVVLVSPHGTKSVLAEMHNDRGSNYAGWTFTSCRNWGESSAGTWSLMVSDHRSSKSVATFNSWQINVYGTDPVDRMESN